MIVLCHPRTAALEELLTTASALIVDNKTGQIRYDLAPMDNGLMQDSGVRGADSHRVLCRMAVRVLALLVVKDICGKRQE